MPYVVLAAVAASFGSLAVVLSSGSGTAGASLGAGSGEAGAGTSSGAGISNAAVQRVKNAVGPGLVVINSRLQDDGDIVGASGTGMIISKSGLVLTNNHVIGMDTAALTEPSASDTTVSQQDTAYAIPINKAMTIARQIIAGKPGPGVHVGATGAIGVLVAGTSDGGQSTQASPQAQLRQMEESALSPGGSDQQAPVGCLPNAADAGIPQRIAPAASGTPVLGAFCDSPAATAGLTAGDVITAVAGKQVSSPASLTGILANESSGKKITIVWVTPTDQTVTRAITLAQVAPQ